MRMRAFLCAVLSSLFVLPIVFSGACIDASALSGGRYMTPQEALQVFGNQIQAQYFDGSDFTDCVFQYDSVQSVSSIESESSYQFGAGSQFLRYYCFLSPGTVVQNPAYITFDITPTYSILNTSQIHSFIALSSRLSVSDSYQSPSWDWSVGGSTVHLENNDRISSGSSIRARLFADGVVNAVFVPFDFSSVSLTSGYSYRATFSGNYGMGDNSNRYALCIGLPYISNDATGAIGTLPPESSEGSGNVNVTVNVDMTETNEKIEETNSILGTIHSWLSSFFSTLGSTVLSWFMPSQNFLSNWVAEIMDMIEEHFSPWPILNERITTIIQNIMSTMGEGGAESVEFPAINVPLDVPGQDPNASFSFSSQSVPLFPEGTSPLRDLVKDGLDMICTIWVLNMVLNRIKAKIVGEQVVEIEGVQDS